MGDKKTGLSARLTVMLGIVLFGLSLNGLDLQGRDIRHNRRGVGKYAGWILIFAVAGTLSAVAAIAIAEAFVPSNLLVLTTGEWELLAAVFYIIAVLLYLGEEHMSRSRA
jgi:hypothetical protein